jgi:perosamine synthetase
VLCDSVPGGFNIDPVDAERRITAKTRAIIPVHVAGEPCDLDAIHALARRRGLRVIEDAAHTLPASYHGRRIGTISELTAFSFYATKTITTGEGGMLATDDDQYAQRAKTMRLHGIGGDAWKRYSKTGSWYYEVQDAGYKMNLPDLLAAVGVAQLKKADLFWKQRSEIAAYYRKELGRFEELEMPPAGSADMQHSWHLLKTAGVGTSVHFIPLHRHPFYVRKYGCVPQDFPQAENSFSRCLSLPIFPDMTQAQQERVVQTVLQVVAKNRKKTLVPVG